MFDCRETNARASLFAHHAPFKATETNTAVFSFTIQGKRTKILPELPNSSEQESDFYILHLCLETFSSTGVRDEFHRKKTSAGRLESVQIQVILHTLFCIL